MENTLSLRGPSDCRHSPLTCRRLQLHPQLHLCLSHLLGKCLYGRGGQSPCGRPRLRVNCEHPQAGCKPTVSGFSDSSSSHQGCTRHVCDAPAVLNIYCIMVIMIPRNFITARNFKFIAARVPVTGTHMGRTRLYSSGDMRECMQMQSLDARRQVRSIRDTLSTKHPSASSMPSSPVLQWVACQGC